MEIIYFTKMSGAGNDFIFIDMKLNPAFFVSSGIVSKLCSRRTGIGADGLIIIDDAANYNFEMSYYNADGSTGSLCGNGARCAIWFARISGRMNTEKVKFISKGKEYSGEVIEDELIKFNLHSPKKIKCNFKIKAYGQLINASFADTGSPHVVISISDVLKNTRDPKFFFTEISEIPVYQIGKEIRYCDDFAPDGTNVNFVSIVNDEIHIRTYERGVEDETLACGTGAAAASLISFVNENLKPPVTLITKGGEKLIVDFEVENKKVKNLSLTGPAKVIFEGSTNRNLFI